jgi:hypothetical protein
MKADALDREGRLPMTSQETDKCVFCIEDGARGGVVVKTVLQPGSQ